ncbi:hypothetical protein [Burkholderia lata]|uniref:hypothetical protein n=1 Tax=Burkholderia lata (strain ATCC 17760 / DSM 23089 / LMG 22485 / NCIMB 9086 / R18194 / 383) TaxID=482957 RepID=UPI001581EF42|nr:hypothetical protein [Burkholderia lata]
MLLLYLGIEFYAGVVAQHVPGYPNRGQLYSCLLLPGGLVALNVVLVGLSGKLRWPYVTLTLSAQFIAVLAFFVLVDAGS